MRREKHGLPFMAKPVCHSARIASDIVETLGLGKLNRRPA
jgi:hypothetical protein